MKGGKNMPNTTAIIIAAVIALILLGSGAAAEIMGAFTSTFGWVIGGLLGLCIICAIIFSVFDRR